MRQDVIKVVGARENNLRNIDVQIPKKAITVFTGVSGSGKSSLVFDTIAAESQRQLNETFPAFIRNLLPKYGQPNVDFVENISTAVIVDQRRLGGGSRSTLATVADIAPLLRLMFAKLGDPRAGGPNVYGFNDPNGMCLRCEGLGRIATLDLDRFLDRSRSLTEGAVLFPPFAVGTWYWKLYAESRLFDNDKALADYTDEEMHTLLHGSGVKVYVEAQGRVLESEYEGLVDRFARLYLKKDVNTMAEKNRKTVLRFIGEERCPACRGKRLNDQVLASKINGHDIADMGAMEVRDLLDVLLAVTHPSVAPVVAALRVRLQHLMTIGLGYLTLDRPTMTLSGGEAQRVKLVRHLTSSLVDMMYIFDEPSVGLHPRDIEPLNDLLRELRDRGNTVLVVEHDPDVIRVADHVVDIGPRAGTAGGQVVYEGDVVGLRAADTLTGTHLRRQVRVKDDFRRPAGHLTVRDARVNNLKNITVDFPRGVLTVVAGVAGSGKSSLVDALVQQHPGAVVVDQSPVSTSSRSTPATYVGLMDDIRKAFARASKVKPALFSFNSDGACPACQGLGVVQTDFAFLDPITSTCDECAGKRFREEVLMHRLRGKSISEVLEMTATEAADYFLDDKSVGIVKALDEVGLGYVRLGQPVSTLSGGECQRLKLATELSKRGSVYVLDEPTTGLHMSDVARLVTIFDKLVDQGNTVIVIEHDEHVIKRADWVIEMGPEAGQHGGEVVFAGTPAQLVDDRRSATGRHLAMVD